MRINLQSLAVAVLGINTGLFGLTALAQTQSTGGNTQATQPQASSTPEPSRPKDASTTTPANPPQPQSLADIARKAKLKKQENQSGNQEQPVKPHVYTEEDFAAGKTVSSPGTQSPQSQPAASGAKNSNAQPGATPGVTSVVIQKFELEKSTIKRPGGSPVDWQIKIEADPTRPNPPVRLTFTFVVTGPCNYKSENSSSGELMPGSGYTDNQYSVAFYESNCAGQYSLELRISSGGRLLKSASTTANIL